MIAITETMNEIACHAPNGVAVTFTLTTGLIHMAVTMPKATGLKLALRKVKEPETFIAIAQDIATAHNTKLTIERS